MRNILVFLLAFWLVLLAVPVFATDDCRQGHEQCGHNDGEGNETTATATATGGDGGEGGDGGDASSSSDSVSSAEGGSSDVQVKNESTSLVLSGARDTAECFTKITIGAEGFGIGFSRKDKYCQKVRRISVQLERENWEAAARLECSLRVWKEIYGRDRIGCIEDLWSGPGTYPPDESPPVPTGSVVLPEEEYESLVMAQVQQEELDEAIEQSEYRYAQQQSLIEELQEEIKDHDVEAEEIERLRREVAEQSAREEAAAARRAAVRAKLLEKKDGEDEPDSE